MLDIQWIDESKAGTPPEAKNFTGRVRMQNLAAARGMTKLELLAVHFDAGAHTRPHTHTSEQVLYFVRGSGFVWLADGERQSVAEGGIVVVPGGIVHMHGATDEGPICHIALRAADGPTDWAPQGVPDGWRDYLAQ